ncbi:hypothetical protein V502_04707 [Pseudogymnoascus sp. VKM F-4520 (FW-2644)]|nr:hypothetical protein V502_04707 [Pseudogymnoascus sp. VKM F-4520 (FW-2644)]
MRRRLYSVLVATGYIRLTAGISLVSPRSTGRYPPAKMYVSQTTVPNVLANRNSRRKIRTEGNTNKGTGKPPYLYPSAPASLPSTCCTQISLAAAAQGESMTQRRRGHTPTPAFAPLPRGADAASSPGGRHSSRLGRAVASLRPVCASLLALQAHNVAAGVHQQTPASTPPRDPDIEPSSRSSAESRAGLVRGRAR